MITVVIGLAPLAAALRERGALGEIVDAPSGSEAQRVLAAEPALRGADPADILFLIGVADDAGTRLARRLASGGFRVVLAASTPIDSDLPVVTLSQDATVNSALIALGRLDAMPFLLPDDAGDTALFPAEATTGARRRPRAKPVAPTPDDPAVDDHAVIPDDAQLETSEEDSALALPAGAAASAVASERQDNDAIDLATLMSVEEPPPLAAPVPITPAAAADDNPTPPAVAPGPPEWAQPAQPAQLASELPTATPTPPPWDTQAVAQPPTPPAVAPGPPEWAQPAQLASELPTATPTPPPTPTPQPPPWSLDPGGDTPTPAPAIPSVAGLDLNDRPASNGTGVVLGSSPALGLVDDPLPAEAPQWKMIGELPVGAMPRRRPLNEPVKVIGITIPKGGTGKSSTALYGSSVLASVGRRVLYVDANAQQADGADMLAAPAGARTIVDLVSQRVTTDTVRSVITPISGFDALFGPRDPSQANPLTITPQLYTSAVAAVAVDYDYIILDGPIAESFRDIVDQFILTTSDFILNVVTPSYVAVKNAHKWLMATTSPAWAGDRAYPADQVGWALNRFEEDVAFDESAAQNSLHTWRYLGKIPDLRSVRRAANMAQIPDDPEYVAAVASVFFAVTADEALRPLMEQAGQQRQGLIGRLRRR
jgi:cellulose biosynthesis protein BcsQ